MKNFNPLDNYDNNMLYIYDLPKGPSTSTDLINYLQVKTGIVLSIFPSIMEDINKPFDTAILAFEEGDKFRIACKELRYFELKDDGKQSRSLPRDKHNQRLNS